MITGQFVQIVYREKRIVRQRLQQQTIPFPHALAFRFIQGRHTGGPDNLRRTGVVFQRGHNLRQCSGILIFTVAEIVHAVGEMNHRVVGIVEEKLDFRDKPRVSDACRGGPPAVGVAHVAQFPFRRPADIHGLGMAPHVKRARSRQFVGAGAPQMNLLLRLRCLSRQQSGMQTECSNTTRQTSYHAALLLPQRRLCAEHAGLVIK